MLARQRHAATLEREARGEPPEPRRFGVSDAAAIGIATADAPAVRDEALTIEASDLRLLGPRVSRRPGRRPTTHIWYEGRDGIGYQVLAELHYAALADLQPVDQVWIHFTEKMDDSIEETAGGRRIPHPGGLRHRWAKARVWQTGTWEAAD